MNPAVPTFIEEFKAKKRFAKDAEQTRLGKSVTQMKRLDYHIQEFLDLLRQDVQEHNIEALQGHIREFDKEIHEEIDVSFARVGQDLTHLKGALDALVTYKDLLNTLTEDAKATSLAESELNYATILHKNAQEKIQTLHLLFKKLT